MAASSVSDVTDGPVLNVINKRLRALRKKLNRILQMEDSLSQGKPLNKEQEDVLRSKPSVSASIDELEKLRLPLSAAVAEEINLASSSVSTVSDSNKDDEHKIIKKEQNAVVEDLLNLLYFGTMFDVKSQSDFTSTMLTRTHERGCCLTYDYVTDDDVTDLLGETDLDSISMLSGLLMSRPVDSSLSHKNALQNCIEHAKQWLANANQPIESDPNVTYAGLRGKLNKIMGSEYFTKAPEMKAAVEMAAAAAGNYGSFQVPVVQKEGSEEQYKDKDEEATKFQGNVTYDNQSSPMEEPYKDEFASENPTEVPSQTELDEPQEGQNGREVEVDEKQYVPRRNYHSQRGGRGGGAGSGRRGYPNGRGGRGSSRGGGAYQNGRNQYYDQSGNSYPRNYYYNRGRGGRGGGVGGGNFNNHSSGVQTSHAPADL